MLKMRKLSEPKNIAEENSFEDTTATLQWLIGRLEPRPLLWMSPVTVIWASPFPYP